MECSSETWAFGDVVKSMDHYTQQLADMWPQKLVLSGIFGSVCSFFYADALLLWIWILTIFADFVVGIIKSKKLNEDITYQKLRQGGDKLILHLACFLIAGTAGVSANRILELNGFPHAPILNGFLFYFTYTELRSITRNIEKMGYKVPVLLKTFLGVGMKKFENEINKIASGEVDESDDKKDGDLR